MRFTKCLTPDFAQLIPLYSKTSCPESSSASHVIIVSFFGGEYNPVIFRPMADFLPPTLARRASEGMVSCLLESKEPELVP
jgi:hypothetical protein